MRYRPPVVSSIARSMSTLAIVTMSTLFLLGHGLLDVSALAAPPPPTEIDGTSSLPDQVDRWNGSRFVVPLTVEELRPRGHGGMDRVEKPVTTGVPIPDSAGILCVEQLEVRGVDRYQIRPLGYWDSGNLKWVLIDFLASVEAGQRREGIVLAQTESALPEDRVGSLSDNLIVLDTGPLWLVIGRQGGRLIQKVRVDGRKIVGGDDSFQLLATGLDGTEFPAIVAPGTKVMLVENGPVKAVVSARGSHVSAKGEHLADFELRITAFRGQRSVSCEYTIKNGSKDSPRHVRHDGIHLRLATSVEDDDDVPSFRFPLHDSPYQVIEPLAAGDRAHYYCAYNESPQTGVRDVRRTEANDGWVPAIPFDHATGRFTETGYRIVKNGVDIRSQTNAGEYDEVTYASVEWPSGLSIATSVRFAARYWPVSYAVRHESGDDGNVILDIGLFSDKAAGPHVLNFLQHETREFALYFSSDGEPPYRTAFQQMYPLLARLTDVRHVNRCGVLSDSLVTIAEENEFLSTYGIALELSPSNEEFAAIRFWDAGQGGGLNQLDITYHNLIRYWRTGDSGAFLSARAWADYRADWAVVRSDDWVHARNGDGRFPQYGAENQGEFLVASGHIFDNQHRHTRGLPLMYYFTGNPRYRSAFLDDTETVTFNDRVSFGYLNTRIQAMLIKNGMLAHTFVGEVDRIVDFESTSPYRRTEIYANMSAYMRKVLDARYDFSNACSGPQPKGWSDDPGKGVNDARRFFFAGGDRVRNEEPKFHLFSMFPDALWNYQYHALPGDPNVQEIRARVVDLEHYFWNYMFSPCLDDISRASIGNQHVRLFGDACEIPEQPDCAQGDDFHPAYALETFAYRATGDERHLERGRIFMFGQHLGSNQLINFNMHRSDFQNFIYQHLDHEPDTYPPITRSLRPVKPIAEPVAIKWESDEPTVGKVVYWANEAPVETKFERHFVRFHAWPLDDLEPLEEYKYFVLNRDEANNWSTSERKVFVFDDFRKDSRRWYQVRERNGGRLNYSARNEALRFRGDSDSKVWLFLNAPNAHDRGSVSLDFLPGQSFGGLRVFSILLMQDWDSYYELTTYHHRINGGGTRIRKIVDGVVVEKLCSDESAFDLVRIRPKFYYRRAEFGVEMRGTDFEMQLATPRNGLIDVQRVLIVAYQVDAWLDNLLIERN